jgi:hypothetical protein
MRYVNNDRTVVISRITIFMITLSFLLPACSSRDSFYRKGSGWDYLRFPLLKPYYAMSLSNEEIKWVIPLERESPLKKESFLMEIRDVVKIAVVDNAIMLYSQDSTKIASSNIEEKVFHWFILIPNEHLEMGFENEDGFLKYLYQNDMDQPQWLEPISVLQEFDQTGCLDWIPDCN